MCPLGFCKIGKNRFSFNVPRKQLKLGFELYLIEIPELFGQKRCLRIQR
jgi:hypothetical protein